MSKFNCLRDEVVHRASLDGCDDELGSVEDFGWYGLVLDFYGKDYIIHEDSNGFVYVDVFDAHYKALVNFEGVPQWGTFRSNDGLSQWTAIRDQYDAWLDEDIEGN